jgi:hypothetical protein
MLPERPLLLVCDVEDTLIKIPSSSASAHRRALAYGLCAVTGLQVALPLGRDGHTDYTLLCTALAAMAMGDALSEEVFALVAEGASACYKQSDCEDWEWCVLPGVYSTLSVLREHSHIVPCSGAVAGIARARIERAGLDGPLLVGYGSYAVYGSTRQELLTAARSRIGSEGMPWPLEKTVVISSCAENLAAAALTGVRTLAVACPQALASASVEMFEQVPHVLVHWL